MTQIDTSTEAVEALADRIEELEAELDWVIVERDETFALMLDRAQTAEAKLAKAVWACANVAKRMADEALTPVAREHAEQIAEAILEELKSNAR